MNNWVAAGLATVLMFGSDAQAQMTFHWPAPESAATSQGQRYYLPMGTPLMLRTRTQISSKDNKSGDQIFLEVTENVSFRGQVIIPIGSPVFAEVSRVQRNGHVGKKGKLDIRLLQVETPHGPVRLFGSASDQGTSGTALSVGTMLLVSPLGGFLIHGTSAELPAGTPVQGILAEDLRFRWYPQTTPANASALPASPGKASIEASSNPSHVG